MAGFNLPPGCSVRDIPGNGDESCQVCGQHEESCICPECPVCKQFGNPDCYKRKGFKNHGLIMSNEQLESLTKILNEIERQDKEEAEFYAEFYDSADLAAQQSLEDSFD